MTNTTKFMLVTVIAIIVGAPLLFMVFIHQFGENFVHDKPASQEYYDNINNRIYFTTKYRGEKFDTLLNKFLKTNPQYLLSDSMASNMRGSDSCNCDCLPLKKFIYFNDSPKEVYYLTYDLDTMYAEGSGVIDIVYAYKNGKWVCEKSSKFDSLEMIRVETRFDTAILKKIN
ncbi:MAG TPA: hypothetical protein VK559_00805 [Ferruginibacter sp.]|nr:hypothetical protein [Ferruginibacter sp.]